MGKNGPGPTPPRLSVIIGSRSNSSRYDEAEFLVGGRGTGAGETEKQGFKLHEGYIAEAEQLVKSRCFPYKTMTDLYRHAIVRHVWWLKSLEPDAYEGSVLYQLAQMDEIVAAEEFQVSFIKNIEATRKMVRNVIQIPGGKTHAGRVLRRLKQNIDKMRDSFWKSYYEKMFLEEFGPYLNDGLVLIAINGEDGGEGDTSPQLSDMEGGE